MTDGRHLAMVCPACGGTGAVALAAKPLKRRLGIPYVMVTHGDIFDRPKGTYDPRLTWFYRQVTRPTYRGADVVVALSPHMREMALRGGAVPERVVVIPNGIDPTEIGLDDARAVSPRKPTGRLELLYVGRLSVEKGVDVLVGAVALLAERNVSFRLRIAGGFDENFKGVAHRFETEFCRCLRRLGGGKVVFEPAASLRHLQAARRSTRAYGNPLCSASSVHSVGEYYLAFREGRGWEWVSFIDEGELADASG